MALRSSSAVRQLVQMLGGRLGTATVLFHAAVADEMGVRVTDARGCSILHRFGSQTAGELAQRLGLTTGAVTGVIDRLERAQLVRRVADPGDRRRVVVELVRDPAREQQMAQLMGPMGERMGALIAGYTAKEQALLTAFLTRACDILEEETARVRAMPHGEPGGSADQPR